MICKVELKLTGLHGTSLLLSHLACYSGYILTFANSVIFLYCVCPVCVLEGDTDVCADVSIHGDGEMALKLRALNLVLYSASVHQCL